RASSDARADATANQAGLSSRLQHSRCYRWRLGRCGASEVAAPAAKAARPSNINSVVFANRSVPSPVAGSVDTFASGFIVRFRVWNPEGANGALVKPPPLPRASPLPMDPPPPEGLPFSPPIEPGFGPGS